MYDLGPLKNERAISKQTIAKVKQDVNLEGDKTMVGKENIAKSMKIAATPKKANPLVQLLLSGRTLKIESGSGCGFESPKISLAAENFPLIEFQLEFDYCELGLVAKSGRLSLSLALELNNPCFCGAILT